MRGRDIIGLGIALIFALGIAVLSRMFFMEENGEPQTTTVVEKEKTVDILIASVPLHTGMRLSKTDVNWIPWPDTALNAAYLTKGEVKRDDLVGSIVRYPLSQGEPVTLDDIVRPGEKGDLAALIDEGKRAVSINVTAATASHGLIHPGDFVDVILSQSMASTDGLSTTVLAKLIVSNVRVVAIDKSLGERPSKGEKIIKAKGIPQTATLELTPGQAEALVKATQEGDLYLSLHGLSTAGKGDVCKNGVCEEEDLQSYTIRIMRGAESEDISVKTN